MLRSPIIIIIIHTFANPDMKKIIMTNVTKACKESTNNINFFLSNLSEKTPAIGKNIVIGRIRKKVANANNTGSCVSTEIHHISTKNTIDDPKSENS